MATGKQVVKEARTQADGSKVPSPRSAPSLTCACDFSEAPGCG